MTVKYYGTPITPKRVLLEAMSGANFCVSYWAPAQVALCHQIGQSVMLDNGAFSAWTAGTPITDWHPYYAWSDQWLDSPTTWAAIPDIIDGDEDDNSRLCRAWPHGKRGAPVWHMHESLHRLISLIDAFPRVCIGSSGEYATVLSPPWKRRMDEAWREIGTIFKRTPTIHMMRGMQLVNHRWPFASVDSTDVARNHNRGKRKGLSLLGIDENLPEPETVRRAAKMRARWDAGQCPARFNDPGEQLEIAA